MMSKLIIPAEVLAEARAAGDVAYQATTELLTCRRCKTEYELTPGSTETLCGRCIKRLRARKLLGEAPDLTAHILAQVTPSGGGAQGPRVSGSRDAGLPLNARALEDANGLYVSLIKWSIGHSRALRVAPPAIALGWSRVEQNPDGLPSWATAVDAHGLMHSIVDWLGAYEEQISRLTIAETFWEDVREVMSPLFGRYPRAPRRPVFASRSCEVCDRRTVIVNLPDDELEPVSVACTFCGHVVPAGVASMYIGSE